MISVDYDQFSPKPIEECIKEVNALYSKGYYDSNPKTNPEYANYLGYIRMTNCGAKMESEET